MKCDGTRAETRFRLSAKRTSTFKSAGASVPSNTGSRGVRNSCSNAGYTMFRISVKSTGYQLHSPVSPSLPLPCVTVCHHVSTGLPTCILSVCLLINHINIFHLLKLLVAHLIRMLPRFLCDSKINFRLHKSTPLNHIMSQFQIVLF